MEKGAHVFFPASRREDPDWLNPKSLTAGPETSAIGRFNDRLDKPLRVETCTEESISWILDVFLDSLIDIDHLAPNLSREKAMGPTKPTNSSASPAECGTHLANGTSR